MATCMANQNSTESAVVRPMPNCTIAITPYIPACQATSDSVSAFSAATIPSLGPSPRMGAMEKY